MKFGFGGNMYEFQRLAIVNRGEPAMRLNHAVEEFNHEHGTHIRTIAFFTEPDRNALFVREADESFALGPALFVDEHDGKRKHTYLDYRRLEEALIATSADAVWVGWGFVAEHAEFADLCRRLGIVFIGPTGDVMRRLGDKINSKLLAEQAHVPVAEWSGGPVETLEAAYEQARRLGYPLMVKATAGGGGRGIRKVTSESELTAAFESARSEALNSFGDATVFLERLVNGARHIEVQIIGDQYGAIWAAGVRDCSVQRRHQKVVEESSSTALSLEQDRMLREAAVRLGKAAGYQNAGTVEFLYDPESKAFSFMEVNARLQVEHPVTEVTTGLDLVKLQLHVARGGKLEGEPPLTIGHAIEVRLNAEDPDNNFAPSPGTIELFRLPTGPGLRIDTGVSSGDTVAPQFDSMIAKIIAYGGNRQEALARLRRALAQSVVVISGGTTNKAFLLELLDRPEMISGDLHSGWLDQLTAGGQIETRRFSDVALLQAAINVYEEELAVELSQFYTTAGRGRPSVRTGIGHTVELGYRGHRYKLSIYRLDLQEYRIDVESRTVYLRIDHIGQYEKRLTILSHSGTSADNRGFRILSVVQGVTHRIEVDGIPHSVSRDEGGLVRAPSPAVVVAINVREGDQVAAGDQIATLEAMKMEMRISAPFAGRIRQILVNTNTQIGTGAPLIRLDPQTGDGEVYQGERIGFETIDGILATQTDKSESDSARRYLNGLDYLRRLLLGFDINPAETMRLIAKQSQLEIPYHGEEIQRREDELLTIFVDLNSLFRRQSLNEEIDSEEVFVSEEYLVTYLRGFDSKAPGIPLSFFEKIRRMTGYYGMQSLDRSPQLVECMFWIYKSRQHSEQHVGPILNLLEHRLKQADNLTRRPGEEFRRLLDRIISVTRNRIPAINDIARESLYRYFERPLFEDARQKTYDQMEADLTSLVTDPEDNRDERLRALVECPYPLVGLFSRKFERADLGARQLILEILTRRYYRIRKLENFRTIVLEGHSFATSEYTHKGRRVHVVTTHTRYSNFSEVVALVDSLIQEYPSEHDIVVDFYVWQQGRLDDADENQQKIVQIINEKTFSHPIRRIVVALACSECSTSIGTMQHFTYRPVFASQQETELDPEAQLSRSPSQTVTRYEEEKIYRNLHPMMGKRLQLWQLSNFDIERLPSAEDIYFFRGVARKNPKDERLFALAEVRDLTPLRSEYGKIEQFPHMERMLLEALAEIRLFQLRRASHERLQWNRVLLYVWPTLNLAQEEFDRLIRRMAPNAEGLGIEQVDVRVQILDAKTSEVNDQVVSISNPGGQGLLVNFTPPPGQSIEPLTEYEQKVVRLLQRGILYPYELITMLTPARTGVQSSFPPGEFVEYDFDDDNQFVPVKRPYGQNRTNIIAGLIRNFTAKYPEGMTRVILLGDPSKEMGSLSEPECRRIMAALMLAEQMRFPVEWFAISAGAKISMESGTENMDWISLVLRRLIDFTQAGGEVNIIVNGINVGAQPYWNAEATMLMHTRGILVMTTEGAMVLTGKQALDYSGSVSAEDNFGIGGYERTMGPNGQAQYFARDIGEACRILLRHYEHSYVIPGERFPRRAATIDPLDRDVSTFPHSFNIGDFATVGEIFSDETNPGRKKPFEIRKIMRAVSDQDQSPLERWAGMRDADTAVVWDAHVGGYPVCMIGFESHPIPRSGFIPADGPDQWTSGTLFPQSSKKVARAINAASNNRPVVVLANLAGFDGSPESMRKVQLEYGAEIGRAVVNFKGPLVFCVISRYHGGAFVVFSRKLNERMEVAALEGTYASVIGGAPAAAVVFSREVDQRTRRDTRIQELEKEISQAGDEDKLKLRALTNELYKTVRSEKLGEVADEFDHVHSVHRALKVGSLDHIIPPSQLRRYIIDAVERGIKREDEARGSRYAGR
jgi:acetyl/propionyl-CoA carboxylase alpha subunit/acetyl-CoA carboxylase carboxyltransferase component